MIPAEDGVSAEGGQGDVEDHDHGDGGGDGGRDDRLNGMPDRGADART
jgi:hypothetical protein